MQIVGVVERRGRLGFLEEPLLGRLVAGQVRREELDGDLALQARILGRVDDAHPAVAEFGADRIRAERGTWSQRHGARLDYSPGRRGGVHRATTGRVSVGAPRRIILSAGASSGRQAGGSSQPVDGPFPAIGGGGTVSTVTLLERLRLPGVTEDRLSGSRISPGRARSSDMREVRIPRHLPQKAIWIREVTGVSAPVGSLGRFHDAPAGGCDLGQELIDVGPPN